jgi:DNA-directed RNA polymerase specialized sigma subunit
VQLLLELYEPLLISRARRVQGRNPNADFRELLSAARQGLLRAAARFDAGRVGDGSRGDRLAALAERYIKNALRDVLTEVGRWRLRM